MFDNTHTHSGDDDNDGRPTDRPDACPAKLFSSCPMASLMMSSLDGQGARARIESNWTPTSS